MAVVQVVIERGPHSSIPILFLDKYKPTNK